MNNTFNIKRFGHVLLSDIKNIMPMFGSTLIAFIMLPIGFWISNIVMPSGTFGGESFAPTTRLVAISMLMIFVAILGPSRLYRTCNIRKEGIGFAMLPASKFEKFLSMILLTLIICPYLYYFAAYLVDMLLYILPWGAYKEPLPIFYGYNLSIDDIRNLNNGEELYYFLQHMGFAIVYFGIFANLFQNALFIWTNTIFKKHKVSKTILWCVFIVFVITLAIIALISSGKPEFAFDIAEESMEYFNIERFGRDIIWAINGILTLIVGGLYFWAWRRLKNMKY